MKTLIIGSSGLVGSALARQIPDAILGVQVEPFKKNQVYTDLVKYESLLKVFDQHRPEMVYLPAYITNVDKCEDLGTNVVNVRGAITVLRLCEQFDSKFVFFSSSYVFDGESKDPYGVEYETRPIQNYGMQKETVEKATLKSDAKFLIVRTVGVYGEERRKKNFAKQVISAIFAGNTVMAPTDQFMNPVLSVDLAKTTILLASRSHGIYHVAGDECVSKFEFARRIAKYFGLDNKVTGVTTEEMKQKAPRPKMGALNCGALNDVHLRIPSFQGGLLHFLEMSYNG